MFLTLLFSSMAGVHRVREGDERATRHEALLPGQGHHQGLDRHHQGNFSDM
jgi:hypothetical protein